MVFHQREDGCQRRTAVGAELRRIRVEVDSIESGGAGFGDRFLKVCRALLVTMKLKLRCSCLSRSDIDWDGLGVIAWRACHSCYQSCGQFPQRTLSTFIGGRTRESCGNGGSGNRGVFVGVKDRGLQSDLIFQFVWIDEDANEIDRVAVPGMSCGIVNQQLDSARLQ